MSSKVEPSVVVVKKEIPALCMDTSTRKPPIVVDGTASILQNRMQYDGRSPYWDEDQ